MKKLYTTLFVTLLGSALTLHAQTDLILTAVFDGNLPGQLPKGVELYVVNDISDMSVYAVGSANNGDGSDGPEFVFPADSFTAGTYLYVASEATGFENFFGFAPNYTGGAVNINGDDAIELYLNDEVVDVYGEVQYETFDESWDYDNGWAYRNNGTGPDGNTFVPGNWTISGVGALAGAATNGEADVPVPAGTYNPEAIEVPIVSFSTSAIAVEENGGSFNVTVNINNANDDATSVEVALLGGTAANGIDFEFSSPQTVTFPAGSTDSQTVTVDLIDNFDEDGELTIEFALQNPDNDAIIGIGDLLVTISDDDATIPLYAIESLRMTDAIGVPELVGEACEIRGRVHGVNINLDGLQFTLIDPTDGIAVFRLEGNLGYTVQEGDSLHVFGELDFFSGLAQVQVDSLDLISSGAAPYPPEAVTAFNEATESRVVEVNCVELVDPSEWTGAGSGFNVQVTDGVNDYTIRIDSAVDLYDDPAPTGVLHIAGIGGQFDNVAPYDNGYQLLPRYEADIVAAGGECLTAVRELPQELLFLYPNPVKNELQIGSDLNISDIRIVDQAGKVVRQKGDLLSNNLVINVENLPAGIYLAEIHTNKGRVVREFVKH